MNSILEDIAEETGGESFRTYKYGLDGADVPGFDYDETQQKIEWVSSGESDRIKESVNLADDAETVRNNPPLFSFFLDGSRRVYKLDDISYNTHVYPVMGGQVGVGCCKRVNKEMSPLYYHKVPMFERHLVISLPDMAKASGWDEDDVFESLLKKINERTDLKSKGIQFDKILVYNTDVRDGERIDSKGIAAIQSYMTEREKHMVAELARLGIIDDEHYLMKDGSLEYQVYGIKSERELAHFRSNYQYVVGVSKSTNPELCIGRQHVNISSRIARLPLYHRTPVNLYRSERLGADMYFAVWFIRIRQPQYTSGAFDGILKVEKILPVPNGQPKVLETEEVNVISAHIINERLPVCYGDDRRWANHLYPIYVTEKFIKSRYLSETMFLNLF